jgi:hypothetical protein
MTIGDRGYLTLRSINRCPSAAISHFAKDTSPLHLAA